MSPARCAGSTASPGPTPTGARANCWSASASAIAPTRCRGICRAASSNASRSGASPNRTLLLPGEPPSALDPELVNEVLEVIRRLAVEDGLTMIIATHQLRFADEVADRMGFLSGGSIIG